jgi:hypothetical protein
MQKMTAGATSRLLYCFLNKQTTASDPCLRWHANYSSSSGNRVSVEGRPSTTSSACPLKFSISGFFKRRESVPGFGKALFFPLPPRQNVNKWISGASPVVPLAFLGRLVRTSYTRCSGMTGRAATYTMRKRIRSLQARVPFQSMGGSGAAVPVLLNRFERIDARLYRYCC